MSEIIVTSSYKDLEALEFYFPSLAWQVQKVGLFLLLHLV